MRHDIKRPILRQISTLSRRNSAGWCRLSLNSSAGSVLERYEYDPYGQVTFLDASFSDLSPQESAIGNEYLYTRRRLDPETGLQLNRERYYHVSLGRWISRDPIGYVDGSNLYN